jgi:HipA-like C-terminal domain
MTHDRVPENEYSMMTLAAQIGMDVPELQLIELDSIAGLPAGIGNLKGLAFAVKRFDRTPEGPVHMEDFAQVFRVCPEDKYQKASYRNIAEVIAAETGNEGVAEFIRRLVFNTLIGNADMHLKNWSLIYPDRRTAALSPAYDFVSTIHYIPDEKAALTYARTKRMNEFSRDELAYLAGKARLPEKLVLDTAAETVERLREVWNAEKKNLPLSKETHCHGRKAHTDRTDRACSMIGCACARNFDRRLEGLRRWGYRPPAAVRFAVVELKRTLQCPVSRTATCLRARYGNTPADAQPGATPADIDRHSSGHD